MKRIIPPTWVSATLSDLTAYIQRGKSPKYIEHSALPVINQKSIRWTGLDARHFKFIHPEQIASWDAARYIRHGDILWNSTGTGTVGRACLVTASDVVPPKVVDSHVTIVRPSDCIDPRYLFYWIKGPEVQHKIGDLCDGSTNQIELSRGTISAIDIPLAPLPEQKRIADKLDVGLARVDACRERLDRASQLLKGFRQSVLRDAISGNLSRQRHGGGAPSWDRLRAAEVCAKVQSGGTPKSGFVDAPGVPFLKVYNIVDQEVSFDYRPQFVPLAVHGGVLSKSATLPGDVLMNIVGPPLGKVAVVPTDYSEWNINQAITLFRPSKRITTGWLYIVLCSGENIREIVNETRGSAGQTNISLSQCRDFVFPVPPVDEQEEIVRQVDKLFALADAIEVRVNAARVAAERLMPALLAKAFRGELMPQDPTDEPAAVLLKRLATQRSGEGEAAKGARAKRIEPVVSSDEKPTTVEQV